MDNWYVLPQGELTPLVPGPYAFVYQDAGGHVLHNLPFDVTFEVEGVELSHAPFVFTLPYIEGTARVIITEGGSTLAQKAISAAPPTVNLLFSGETVHDRTTVTWTGNDADGDALTYTLLFSPDNGSSWEPIAGELTETAYSWDVSGLPPGNQYRLKVIVNDGFRTTEAVSNVFAIAGVSDSGQTYLPFIRAGH